jgi:5-methylcytosine-specific restriction protein A
LPNSLLYGCSAWWGCVANKSLRFCSHTGCSNLTPDRYCEAHQSDAAEQRALHDKRRGSSRDRGYTYRWEKYSKWFLAQPGNQLCKLHLDDGCAIVAQCVDHIKPHKGYGDPNLWNPSNLQASCIHCNSVKGNKTIKGTYTFGDTPCADTTKQN